VTLGTPLVVNESTGFLESLAALGLREVIRRPLRGTLVLARAFVPAGHRSSPPAAPVAPLGVRWSLVDGSGPVAAQMRKVEPGVGHARNRFGEPVPKPYRLVLRSIFVVHTWVRVSQECNVDFVPNAR
jgi:hypothetical protein